MKKFFRELIKQNKDIKQFAKEIGVTTQTVYSWKTGKSKPKPGHIQKISKILHIDIDIVIDDFHN